MKAGDAGDCLGPPPPPSVCVSDEGKNDSSWSYKSGKQPEVMRTFLQ